MKDREFSGRVQIDLYLESSEERSGLTADEVKQQLEALLLEFTGKVAQPATVHIELTQGVWKVTFPASS